MQKHSQTGNIVLRDPISFIGRVRTKLNSIWLQRTYPFASFGDNVAVHYTCDIKRGMSPYISFGSRLYLAQDIWLNVIADADHTRPKIRISTGCKLGRRSNISAKNEIILEEDVLLAPNVLIMDHNHAFSNPDIPIHSQGVTPGGKIVIERNCWLGYGAVVFCNHGSLTVGRNSVVGANSVVTRSFPPCSVIAGNPAKLVRRLDVVSGLWIKESEALG
jgi:acetyltransferase-like isoleucine patch superfamily enzyme